jgi:hypothetical protein
MPVVPRTMRGPSWFAAPEHRPAGHLGEDQPPGAAGDAGGVVGAVGRGDSRQHLDEKHAGQYDAEQASIDGTGDGEHKRPDAEEHMGARRKSRAAPHEDDPERPAQQRRRGRRDQGEPTVGGGELPGSPAVAVVGPSALPRPRAAPHVLWR